MSTYRGFSTVNELSQKKFVLTDFELIKQDLINALNTRIGTRVMFPAEGCLIWDALFEPLTETLKTDLFANVTKIVQSDPRLQLSKIDITSENNSITLSLDISYSKTNQVETLRLLFDAQNNMITIV